MYQLMVSHNCGISYVLDREAKTVEELKPRMDELDEKMQRWSLDKDGELVHDVVCRRHAGILGFFSGLNQKGD